MRAFKAAIFGLAAGLALAVFGCPSPETDGGSSDAGGPVDSGNPPDYAFVTNDMTLPVSGGPEIGFDLDCDGTVDNAMGALLTGLGTLFGDSFDAQEQLDQAILDASILIMWNLVGASDFTTDAHVGMGFYLGEDYDEDPADNFSGSEDFDISADDPGLDPLVGLIGSGVIVTEPSDLLLRIPLSEGLDPMDIHLYKGHVEAGVSATALSDGTIGGAITEQEMVNTIFPAIAEVITTNLASYAIDGDTSTPEVIDPIPCVADNPGPPVDPSAIECRDPNSDGTEEYPTAICSAWNGTATGFCVDSTETLISIIVDDSFDINGDGVITGPELEENDLIQVAINYDLDLFDATGAPYAECCSDDMQACGDTGEPPCCDGENDAMSLGLAFTAVGAVINF